MKLSDVAAAVSLLAKHVADANGVLSQTAFRPFRHAVQGDAVSFRVHSGQEDSSVRTAERTIADSS